MTRPDRQLLIFDGDDTLWENNVHFEQVIEDAIDLVAETEADRAPARQRLDDIERANSNRYGYGVTVFERSLSEFLATYRPGTEHSLLVQSWCRRIVEAPAAVIGGVAETLAELGRRHSLQLLTKGDPAEQQAKVAASGLAGHFDGVTIVAEKTPAVYHDVVRETGSDVAHTWMIGNSPRSDILPARMAGLGAVLIPHHATWQLEMAKLPAPDGRFVVVDAFRSLTDLF